MTDYTVKLKRSSSSGGIPNVTDLSLGELAVNTFDGKLFFKKDNGTASIIEVGSGSGGGGGGPSTAVKILLYEKANTGNADSFDGTETRFQLRDENGGVISNLTSASQLLISIDGVVQEPNSGSSGTDGFYISNTANGTDIIFLAAPASGSDFFGMVGILSGSFATVATSGDYDDLTNKPTLSPVMSVAGKTGTVALIQSDIGSGAVTATTGTYSGGATFGGSVGIGCTPVRDLQLHAADASSELMLSNSTTGATAGSGFMIQQDGNDNYIWNKENSFMSFGTDATEQMRIDNSGRVGIGETNPVDLLHIKNASGNANVRLTTGNTSSGYTGLVFGDTSDTNTGAVQYDHSNDSLQFEVNNSERLRIDSTGDVEIGSGKYLTWVASPGGTHRGRIKCDSGNSIVFENTGGNNERLRIDSSGNVDLTGGGNLVINEDSKLHLEGETDDDHNAIWKADTENTLFLTSRFNIANIIDSNSDDTTGFWSVRHNGTTLAGSSELMRVESSGKVGIGTASPDVQLHVNEPSGAHGKIKLSNTEGSGIIGTNSNVLYFEADRYFLYDETGNDTHLAIDSSGNVGIGGTATGNFGAIDKGVLITGTNAQVGLRVETSHGSSGILEMSAESGGVKFDTRGSGHIRFASVGTEFMRIDGSGNVGIGTSSPTNRLHLYHETTNLNLLIESGDANAYIGFKDSSTTSSSSVYMGAEGNAFKMFTSGDERLRVDSSGRVLVGCSSTRNNSITNAQFQIEGTSAPSGSMSLIRNGSGNPAYLIIGSSGGGSLGSLTATLGDQYIGQIVFSGSNGSSMRPGAYISARNDQAAAWTAGDCPTRLEFSVTGDGAESPTEKMRLESSGTLRTRMTGSAGRFHLASDQSAGSTILLNCVHSRNDITTGGSASCRIFTDGDIQNTNNSYTALSDITLKENIFDANSQWEDIKRLRIRKFNFKAETGNSTHTQIGVIAQEVELVSPGLVKVRPALTEEGEDSGETVKTVSSSVLYMKAVKALQEALERIEALEQRLSDASIA
jgi:hypothetical protein